MAQAAHDEVPVTVKEGGQYTEIGMGAQAGLDLHQKWMDQAFSSLMAAVAAKK